MFYNLYTEHSINKVFLEYWDEQLYTDFAYRK